MAWNTQKMPIAYLEQRIKYFRRMKAQFSTLEKVNSLFLDEPMTQEGLDQVHANIDWKIKKFEDAIIILTENGFDDE